MRFTINLTVIFKIMVLGLLIFKSSFIEAQSNDNIKEDLKGNVKSMRVTIEFVKDSVQNLKLFSIDDDYGHTGFRSPAAVKSNFDAIWKTTTATRYLNYYQERDYRDSITRELWLNKKNKVVKDYRYIYDFNSKLVLDTSRSEEEWIFDKYCDFIKYYYEENQLVKKVEVDYWEDHEHLETYTYNREKHLINNFRYIIISDDSRYIDGNFYFYEDSLLVKTLPYSDYADTYDKGYQYVYDDKKRLKEVYQLLYYKWMNVNDTIKKTYSRYPIKKLSRKNDYDLNGNLIKEMIYKDYEKDNDSIILTRTITRTFEKGLEIEEKTVYNDFGDTPWKSQRKKSYDDEQRLIKYERISNDSLELTRTYNYNLNSEIKSLTILNKDKNWLQNGNVVYEYVYDSVGNWIKQTKSVNGKSLYIWRREIKYFP